MVFRSFRALWPGPANPPPNAPTDVPAGALEGCLYAVGDIHGRADKLSELAAQIATDYQTNPAPHAEIVFLGDYLNRGPASAEVIAFLRHGLAPFLRDALRLTAAHPLPFKLTFLAGNHERATLAFLQNPATRPDWLGWGGTATLESYGLKPFNAHGPRELPALAAELEYALNEKGDLEWLHSLPLRHVVGPYALVHAGVRPGVPLHNQLEDDLTFIREDWWHRPHGLPYTVVFGHTPLAQPLIGPDRIGIDTGAYRTGILTAVALRANQAPYFLQTQP